MESNIEEYDMIELTILGQDVADRTRQEIAWDICKFSAGDTA